MLLLSIVSKSFQSSNAKLTIWDMLSPFHQTATIVSLNHYAPFSPMGKCYHRVIKPFPSARPKPSNRTQFSMLCVFDFQPWDVPMVHVSLHCMSGLHWLLRDVCMLACALLLTLDRLVYACLSALCCWRWIVWCMLVSCIDSDVHSCFELRSAFSQSSWIRRYIKITYY